MFKVQVFLLPFSILCSIKKLKALFSIEPIYVVEATRRQLFLFLFFPAGLSCNFEIMIMFCTCSGQRVIVQEKNEDQEIENVVTIQVQGYEHVRSRELLDELLT